MKKKAMEGEAPAVAFSALLYKGTFLGITSLPLYQKVSLKAC